MVKMTKATMKRKILQKLDDVILFAFNYDGCYFYLYTFIIILFALYYYIYVLGKFDLCPHEDSINFYTKRILSFMLAHLILYKTTSQVKHSCHFHVLFSKMHKYIYCIGLLSTQIAN
jgi:hypothetical protein